MATDIKKVLENLLNFYDFSNKTVISVGAGGGQIAEFGRKAKKVFAVDIDAQAIVKLKETLAAKGLANYEIVECDFYKAVLKGDVLLFDFCLHEMEDPALALKRAREMAADVVVFDHMPASEWAWCVFEDKKVANSWKAAESAGIRHKQAFDAIHTFADYDELYNRIKVQGEESIRRLEKYRGKTHITIPMSYGIALL